MKYYDISVSLENEMLVWPGDPGIVIEKVQDLEKGDAATVSRIEMGLHTGTHVDAPSHFISGGKTVEKLDLDILNGLVAVVEVDLLGDISRNTLAWMSDYVPWTIMRRVLFKTRNSQKRWPREPFQTNFAHLTLEAATFLVERGIDLVGIDYLSVEGYAAQGAPAHRKFLSSGVHILEGLYLGHVPEGWYELLCLPMKIRGAEGAPARAVLREIPEKQKPSWHLFPRKPEEEAP